MDDKGWFKIWRRLRKDKVWTALSRGQKADLIALLGSACYEPVDWACQKCCEQKTLEPGCIYLTHRKISDEWGLDSSSLLRTEKKLVALKFLNVVTRNRCHRVYLVNNWDKFQGGEAQAKQERSTSEAQAKQERSTSEAVSIYKKSIRSKEYKEVKNNKATLFEEINLLPQEAVAAADHLHQCILRAHPKHKLSTVQWDSSKERLRWAQEFEKANRIEKRSWSDLKAVTGWALADKFWSPIIQSAKKLRDKYDTIMGQMNRTARHTGQCSMDPDDWNLEIVVNRDEEQ